MDEQLLPRSNYWVSSVEINANLPFEITHNNVISESTNITLEYPNHIYFKPIPNSKLLHPIIFLPNPKIQAYQTQIALLHKSLELEQIFFHKKTNRIRNFITTVPQGKKHSDKRNNL